MSHVLSEVLDSNRKYAAAFGAKGNLALPPAVLPSSLAWTRAWIPRSLPGSRKATRT
jgi:hypothetical protein